MNNFQESDLISKLCRKTKEGVDESSDEEVSTPEKIVKGNFNELQPIRDKLDVVVLDGTNERGKGLVSVSGDCDVKVKRRLDDEFSTSKAKRKQAAVVVKKEKP